MLNEDYKDILRALAGESRNTPDEAKRPRLPGSGTAGQFDSLTDEEIETLWLEEAARRDEELDRDPRNGIPLDEALVMARSLH